MADPDQVVGWVLDAESARDQEQRHTDAAGRPSWKCRAYNCGKKITKTKARELGLLP